MAPESMEVDYTNYHVHMNWLTYFGKAFALFGDVEKADEVAKRAVELIERRSKPVRVPGGTFAKP
jgi:hypothetical protein